MKERILFMNKIIAWSLIAVVASSFSFSDGLIRKASITTNTSGEYIDLSDTSDEDVIAYYDGVDGKSGEDLKSTLNTIISTDTETIDDSETWDWMKITDRDWSISSDVDPYNYNFDLDTNYYFYQLYASYNGDASTAVNRDDNLTDREHCWPKSYGFKFDSSGSSSSFVSPAGTDLHHLMAADKPNNEQGHNNYSYGNVEHIEANEIEDSSGVVTGWKGDSTMSGNEDELAYEPADIYKGDVARACLYMATRYIASSDISPENPYLSLTDNLENLIIQEATNPTGIGTYGELSTLLEWNDLDPVDDFEIHRNNLIYNNVHKNRNPYIDHPEWAEIVYDEDYLGSGAVNSAPAEPDTSGSSTGDTSLDPIEDNAEVTYTTQNILSSSNAGDSLIGESVSTTAIVGNQIDATVLSSNKFGGMFVNGYYRANAVVGDNKLPITGSDATINNYYTSETDSLVFVLDSNEKLLKHVCVETGSTLDQATIDDWNMTSAPVGYTNDVWYRGNEEFTASTVVTETTILKSKLTYNTENSYYQVAVYGDTASLTSSEGATGSEVDVQFDKTVTLNSTNPNFSYWKIGNRIVSYDSTYTFTVYIDTVIEEVTDVAVTENPVINLYHKQYDGGLTYYFVCGYSLPDGYTAIETGMLFGGETFETASEKTIANTISSNDEYAVKYTSSDYAEHAAYLAYKDAVGNVSVIYDNGFGYEQLYFNNVTSSRDAVVEDTVTEAYGDISIDKSGYTAKSSGGIKLGTATDKDGSYTLTLPDNKTASKVIVSAIYASTSENNVYINDIQITGLTSEYALYECDIADSNTITVAGKANDRCIINYIGFIYSN